MSAGVVEALRARPGVVRLAGATGGGDALDVRVQIPEVWDAVRFDVPPTVSVLEVKRHALAELLPNRPKEQDYVVKLRGYEILDESVSLAAAGARTGSTLLITSRRRRPVH